MARATCTHNAKGAAVVLAALALLAACAPPLPERPELPAAARPASFPLAHYVDAARKGEAVFEVEAARSLVTIDVLRAGSLARLGHDHVVASRDVQGFIAPAEGRADFYVRLDRLTVDEPALRRQAGFDTQPSADDIAGTRRNMLERELRTNVHPYAEVAIRHATGTPFDATITLNGITHNVPVEATVTPGTNDYVVAGMFSIDQTDFGLRPYSLFNGALTVADRLNLYFTIHARRIRTIAPQ